MSISSEKILKITESKCFGTIRMGILHRIIHSVRTCFDLAGSRDWITVAMDFFTVSFFTNRTSFSITYWTRNTRPCGYAIHNQSSTLRTFGTITVIRIVRICISVITSARRIAANGATSTGIITTIRTANARIMSTIGALGITSAWIVSAYETIIASTWIISTIVTAGTVINVLSTSGTILNQDFTPASVIRVVQTTKCAIIHIIFPIDRITGNR